MDLAQVGGGGKSVSFRGAGAIHTLLSFREELPDKFLRGCGPQREEIDRFRSRLYSPSPSCFISYSTANEEFASRLYNDFQEAGIPCWKWNKDARTGESMWGEVDQAIRGFDKLVVIAGESSPKSPYVMDEIERAIQEERDRIKRKNEGTYHGNVNVLFPVRLDDYIFEGWQHERKVDVVKKVIADARGWDSDPNVYAKVRDKLIEDLKDEWSPAARQLGPEAISRAITASASAGIQARYGSALDEAARSPTTST